MNCVRLMFAALLLSALAAPALATEVGRGRDMGVGFSVGDPTGIVGKIHLGPENALDAGLSLYSAWGGRCRDGNDYRGCGGYQHISFNMDYLWQYNLLQSTARLDWHIGPGGRIWLWSGDEAADDFGLAARMPVGIDFMPANPNLLEVYLEFVPTLHVVPFMGFYVGAALGVRFYF